MASPSEATYAVSTTVVEAKPRVREEVREELREEIRLLDMPRIDPDEKLRLEREAVASAVGEVELFERSWRKTQPDTIIDIERRIDALSLMKNVLPAGAEIAYNARSTPAPAAPAPPPPSKAPDFTPAPATLPSRLPSRPLPSRLSPSEQRAIAKHLGGTLQRAHSLFTTTRGRVVEVDYKKGGASRTTTVILRDNGEVATLDEVGKKLDGMAMPSLPAAAPPVRSVEESLGPTTHAPPPSPKKRAEAGPGGRTPAGLLPTVANQVIENIEGIGATYGEKLRAEGVEIIEDLLLVADLDDLARRTGISGELLRKWQDMGRLQAVNGIGPQYSELLVRAGVRSLDDLAKEEPRGLERRLNEYEASLGVRVQGNPITEGMTAEWVRQARELTGSAAPPAAEKPKAPPKVTKKGGLSLGLGKRKPAPAPAAAAPGDGEGEAPDEAPKKKFGFGFGRK